MADDLIPNESTAQADAPVDKTKAPKLKALGAVVNTTSNSISILNAGGTVQTAVLRGPVTKTKDSVTIGATDTAGSVYPVIRVRSNTILDVVEILNVAQAGSTNFQVGVYNIAANGGNAINPNLFGTVDLSVARNGSTGRYNARYNGSAGLASMNQPLWFLLGLTLDPNCYYDICLTSVTQGAAGGLAAIIAENTFFGLQS